MKFKSFCAGFSVLMSIGSFVSCSKQNPEIEKKTLNLVAVEKVKGLDPLFADDLYSGREVMRVHEGLYEYHYLKRPYEMIPVLAESLPAYSKDGLTITIPIKKGVLFQDDAAFPNGKGRELVAEDFIYSMKRHADPKNNSPLWWLLDGKVVGLNEWGEEARKTGKADYTKSIEGLQAPESHKLVIKLTKRSYQFIYGFAMPGLGVVAHEAIEKYGDDYRNRPVGTGPFKVVEYSAGSKIVYERNPNYRESAVYPSEGMPEDKAKGLLDDAGKKLPMAERVVLHTITEDQPRWLGFLQGKYDLIAVPKDNYKQAFPTDDPTKLSDELVAKGIRAVRSPELDFTRTSFNMDDPLFGKNKYLRQAIALSLDQKEFNRLFYNNNAIKAEGIIPPGLDGYDPTLVHPYRTHDLKKAKELLAKAGYPDGKGLPELIYLSLAGTSNRQIREFEIKCLSEIGVKVKLETSTWPEFQEKIKTRQGHIWGFAWSADYPDAENFVQLFYSKNRSPGPNDSGYNNPAYDALYEKSLTLPPGKERTEIYKRLNRMIVEDVPSVPGAHRISVVLVQPWVKNVINAEFDHAIAKYFRVDGEEKAKRLGLK